MSHINSSKEIRALKHAIESLTKDRRRFSPGHVAFISGIRKIEIDSEGITGTLFSFSEEDHKKYLEITDDIDRLYDLIDILSDPGVTGYTQGELNFEESQDVQT